jgi:HEPN domain-containing protein
MNSSDFQKLSVIRLAEAKALLRNKHYAGAYYLAGYSVECALKACIAAKTNATDFPPKPDRVREYYKHDLESLVTTADLKEKLEAKCRVSEKFCSNWETVKDWTEQTRYETNISYENARGLVKAISDTRSGVLTWMKSYF